MHRQAQHVTGSRHTRRVWTRHQLWSWTLCLTPDFVRAPSFRTRVHTCTCMWSDTSESGLSPDMCIWLLHVYAESARASREPRCRLSPTRRLSRCETWRTRQRRLCRRCRVCRVRLCAARDATVAPDGDARAPGGRGSRGTVADALADSRRARERAALTAVWRTDATVSRPTSSRTRGVCVGTVCEDARGRGVSQQSGERATASSNSLSV